MTPFYYEAELKFLGMWTCVDEHKKGIVFAANEKEARQKVIAEYEGTGGRPMVEVAVFPTIGAAP